MIGNPAIFDDQTIDWSAFASGYRKPQTPKPTTSPLIGQKFNTPIRVFTLKAIQCRDTTIWYQFNISTNGKTMPKWFKATECELC